MTIFEVTYADGNATQHTRMEDAIAELQRELGAYGIREAVVPHAGGCGESCGELIRCARCERFFGSCLGACWAVGPEFCEECSAIEARASEAAVESADRKELAENEARIERAVRSLRSARVGR